MVFKAKNYYTWTASALTVKTSVDSKYFELTNDFVEYTVVLNCNENDQIEFFSNTYYPMLQYVKIYSGEVTAPQLRAEEGNETYRLITGITDKFYTVNNLLAEGTFDYRVKALYTDGTESAWSNKETVTLVGGGTVMLGDVDDDGEIGISDVSALVDYLLDTSNTINLANADVDEDGEIGISDVSALVDMLLGN